MKAVNGFARHLRSKPWRVVRQYNDKPDEEICQHRWEWTAELHATQLELSRAYRSERGVFYTARPTWEE